MKLKALHDPFPAAEIEWRVGSTNTDKTRGLALAYLTARHVMERLDAVCGAENWQDRYEFHGTRTVCYLSIKIGDEWVTKADGAGDSDVEAEKGAISDALKRAAVKWGIGRYLYALASPWVELEAAGRSYKIKASEYSKLEAILTRQFSGHAPQPAERPALTQALADSLYDALATKLKAATSEDDLRAIWRENVGAIDTLPSDVRETLTSYAGVVKAQLANPPAKNLGTHLDNIAGGAVQ